jgi:hypothetical protein
MVLLPEIVAVMEEVTSTTTVAVPGPQAVVAVTTYVVVEAGVAMGLEIVELLRPVAGDQEYEVPPPAVKEADPPLQIVVLGLMVTVGELVTVTSTG